MSLANELKLIQEMSSISLKDKDRIMKDTIDTYVNHHNSNEHNLKVPLLIRVLNGETSFKQEYDRLKGSFTAQTGNALLVGYAKPFAGDKTIESMIYRLDQVITKLQKPKKDHYHSMSITFNEEPQYYDSISITYEDKHDDYYSFKVIDEDL